MAEFLKVINVYSDSGDRVSFVSTSVYPRYPTLIYADRLSGTRFMSAFPIALAYSDVEASDSMACPPGFVIHDYLVRSGWLDEYMNNYQYLLTCRGFEVCRLKQV